jgi:hypothetical protein
MRIRSSGVPVNIDPAGIDPVRTTSPADTAPDVIELDPTMSPCPASS